MSLFVPQRDPDRGFLVRFSLGLVGCFALLGVLQAWRSGDWLSAMILWTIGFVTGGVCLVDPKVARSVYTVWTTVLSPVAWLLSTVLLTIVYFGIVTPTAWLRRWRNPDPLNTRFDREADTYWVRRPPSRDDPDAPFRQF